MKHLPFKVIALFIFIVYSPGIFAQDTLIDVLKDEIKRESANLASEKLPPYFIEYRVDDLKAINISTSFGSLVDNDEEKGRVLTASVKVGSYNFDNTHEIEGAYGPDAKTQPVVIKLPFENLPDAIKVTLWQATHYAYRNAVDAYNRVISSMKDQTNVSKVPDFSTENPSVYFEPEVVYSLENKNDWIDRLKQYSEPFLEDDKIISADANFLYTLERKYFVSSEGSSVAENSGYCQLQITARTKADDGSILPLYLSYSAFSPKGLPVHEKVLSDIKVMMLQLKRLRKAPAADSYTGPAILSSSAAAVFFHEIFGHRIEGERLKSDFDSQIFKAKVGERVLPKYISIISDPSLSNFNSQDMFGYYKYDDQGMEGKKVTVVKDGILENFLMSRTPIDGFLHSNGHGRAQVGLATVSRQSNLIVETKKPFSDKELRKKLIDECKKQNKEYGYLFQEVVGGFTLTTRFIPNVFNVKPTVVYRIYVDGRPDEMVRGVDFIGTPLAIFSEVEATGDNTGVFTGYCGAESGNIPVTAVSPSLFIKKIETQKQPEGYGQMPILPRPDVEKLSK
jgi:TldD protein